MGFWGPTLKERNRAGKLEWYGKCEECSKEYFDYSKRKATKKLEDCAKVDKTAKERVKQAKRDALAAKAQAKSMADQRRQDEAEERAKNQLAKKGRELKRLAKNKKCPFCGRKPCKGSKPKCASVIAAGWTSTMDVDPGSMGSYDSQMSWYQRNME